MVSLFRALIVWLLIILSLASCYKPVPLFDLESANTIEIYDGMGGLHECNVAFDSKHYVIQRKSSGYEGRADFSALTWPNGENYETTEEIIFTIPDNIMQSFIQKLEEAKMKSGKYKPEFLIDCDPSISIQFYLENKNIEYSSTSCGDNYTPWKVTLSENEDITYIIQTEEPALALEMLSPYLRPDAYGKFFDEICSTMR